MFPIPHELQRQYEAKLRALLQLMPDLFQLTGSVGHKFFIQSTSTIRIPPLTTRSLVVSELINITNAIKQYPVEKLCDLLDITTYKAERKGKLHSVVLGIQEVKMTEEAIQKVMKTLKEFRELECTVALAEGVRDAVEECEAEMFALKNIALQWRKKMGGDAIEGRFTDGVPRKGRSAGSASKKD